MLMNHVGPHTPSAQEGLERMWECKQVWREGHGVHRQKEKRWEGCNLEATRVRRVDVNCIDRWKSVEGWK